MATTEILPFAIDPAANVQTQADYEDVASRTLGFSDGIAPTQECNKIWRQSAFMAAGLANWCVSQGVSVPDDGNLTNLVTELQAAIKSAIDAEVSGGAALPAGSMFNLQSTTTTAKSNITGSAAWQDVPGLSVAITPAVNTHKVLVRARVNVSPGGSGNVAHLRLMRGSTPLDVGDASSSRIQAASTCRGDDGSADQRQYTIELEYLDSPGSTSAQTYKVQAYNANGQEVDFNGAVNDVNAATVARTTSTITVCEVKA